MLVNIKFQKYNNEGLELRQRTSAIEIYDVSNGNCL